MRKFLSLWLPVIVWMAIIFAGSSIGSVPQISSRPVDGVIHRAAHVIEFAILGLLVARAGADGKSPAPRLWIITLTIAMLYGASDEFHQRFVPGRNSELIAVLWDVLGGALGVWVWQRWYRRINTSTTGSASRSR